MGTKTWEDTVMSDEQLDDIGYPIMPINSRRVAKAQAEISFKEGEKKVVDFIRKRYQVQAEGGLKAPFIIVIPEMDADWQEFLNGVD